MYMVAEDGRVQVTNPLSNPRNFTLLPSGPGFVPQTVPRFDKIAVTNNGNVFITAAFLKEVWRYSPTFKSWANATYNLDRRCATLRCEWCGVCGRVDVVLCCVLCGLCVRVCVCMRA